MKVRATKLGYYNRQRRRPGVVFMVDEPRHFSKNWMEEVDKSELLEPKTAAFDVKLKQARKEHVAAVAATIPPEPVLAEARPQPQPSAEANPEKQTRGRGKRVSSGKPVL